MIGFLSRVHANQGYKHPIYKIFVGMQFLIQKFMTN